MSGLRKRRPRFKGRLVHPIARAFHLPQRDHAPKVQHPKPKATR